MLLLGRDGELGAAREALAARGAVLLTGATGIGLSTLAEALGDEAGEAGWTVLRCEPAAEERELPHVGLADLLGCLPGDVLDRSLAALAQAPRAALRAALLRDRPPVSGVDRLALRLGLLELLRSVAPVLVVLDGADRLDLPSAAALRFALRRGVRDLRGLRVGRGGGADEDGGGSGRDPEGGGGGAVAGRVRVLATAGAVLPGWSGAVVPVGGLRASALAAVVRREVPGCTAAVLRDVQRVAAGNPGTAVALARGGYRWDGAAEALTGVEREYERALRAVRERPGAAATVAAAECAAAAERWPEARALAAQALADGASGGGMSGGGMSGDGASGGGMSGDGASGGGMSGDGASGGRGAGGVRSRARAVLLRAVAQAPVASGGLVAAGLAEGDRTVLPWAAERALLAGRLDEAAVYAAEAGAADPAALVVAARVELARGSVVRARRTLDAVAALPVPLPPHRRERWLAAELAAGRPERVLAAARGSGPGADGDTAPALLALRTAALAQQGDGASALGAAAELVELLARYGEPLPLPGEAGGGEPRRAGAALAVARAELLGGSAERARELAGLAAAQWGAAGAVLPQGQALAVAGEAALLLGPVAQTAAGVAELQEVRRLASVVGAVDPATVRALALLAEGLVALGETGEAAEVAGEAAASLRSADGTAPAAVTAVRRAAALVRAGLGDGRAAVELLRAEADGLRAEVDRPGAVGAGLEIELARTLIALGTVERRLRHRPGARAALLEAGERCARLAARPLLLRAAAELDRVDRALAVPGAAGGLLTASERRVADLAADGATNREVAAALFVSVKTVEGTLSRVYRKLGVRSRSGLARALAVYG
ncbi:AAA family ATPase [Kitasatospora sp. NPDC058965]|uniref:helix-turn-helix transcriptional regulator n=1 Tax=Kitasatospora sp. NPDC058965 TaxID=3346682 RepID=UPI00367C1D2C